MMHINITTEHAASSYGRPVIIIDDKLVEDQTGILAIRCAFQNGVEDIAQITGYSENTVKGWVSGKPLPTQALCALMPHFTIIKKEGSKC